MTQAYPQFTPGQILEAGERALADGRPEYATQFFQHLVDHHTATPEAARAREALARLSAAAAPQYVNGHGSSETFAPNQQSVRTAPGTSAQAQATPPPYTTPAQQDSPRRPRPSQPSAHSRQEPSFGTPPPAPEMPRYMARPAPMQSPVAVPPEPTAIASREAAARRSSAAPERLYIPAPEKHYIVGRVIAGILLLVGIVGSFAGIGLIFAAVSDPKIFAIIGATGAVQALSFALTVFLGSLGMLLVSQVATAVFNGADAACDVARLERYRAGDYDEDED